MKYRGYEIIRDPKPIPLLCFDWTWSHEDYDGAPDSGDRRCGASGTLKEALSEIDEQIEDRLLDAMQKLVDAAQNRENTMGDPIRLLECQATLRSAIEKARDAIAAAEAS